MRILALITVLLSSPGYGEDSGVAQADPAVFFKIVAAIGQSELPELKSNKGEDGITYHLRGVRYLGQVHRDGRTYSVAQATFVRSSPPGTDVPPPRGHDFVILLDPSFRIVGCGRSTCHPLHMNGSKLMEKDTEVADFKSTDIRVRHSGFAEINMPYPFADRITDKEWSSGHIPPSSEISPKPGTEQAAPPGGKPSN